MLLKTTRGCGPALQFRGSHFVALVPSRHLLSPACPADPSVFFVGAGLVPSRLVAGLLGWAKQMLVACKGVQAKYIIRGLQGKMRIGLSSTTVMGEAGSIDLDMDDNVFSRR